MCRFGISGLCRFRRVREDRVDSHLAKPWGINPVANIHQSVLSALVTSGADERNGFAALLVLYEVEHFRAHGYYAIAGDVYVILVTIGTGDDNVPVTNHQLMAAIISG